MADTARAYSRAATGSVNDADAPAKAAVSRAQAELFRALRAEGLAVEVMRWDGSNGKGLDDLLLSGGEPETLAGGAAEAHVRGCLTAATGAAPASRLRPGKQRPRTVMVTIPWGARS